MTRLPVVVSTKTSGKFNCLWGLYCNVAISDKDVSYIRRPRCNSYTTLGTLQPAVCNSIFNHTRVTSHNKRMTRGVHPMIAIKMNRFRNAIFLSRMVTVYSISCKIPRVMWHFPRVFEDTGGSSCQYFSFLSLSTFKNIY